MPDETSNLVLEHLVALRNELRDFKHVLQTGMDDLKYRVSSLEQQVAAMKTELAHLRADLAHYSLRQDEHDRRLVRIEQRLELRERE